MNFLCKEIFINADYLKNVKSFFPEILDFDT